MGQSALPRPGTGRQLIDAYFLDNRSRLLEIAAFLDRADRMDREVGAVAGEATGDHRMRAFRRALEILCSDSANRTEEIQLLFSSPFAEPLERPDGLTACGAYDRLRNEEGA